MKRRERLPVERHAQCYDVFPTDALGESKGTDEESKLHGDDHQPCVDSYCDGIDAAGHAPFHDALRKLEEKSVRSGPNLATEWRDAKPCPFGDARTARRLHLAELVENAA
jgi:hypothetical protein